MKAFSKEVLDAKIESTWINGVKVFCAIFNNILCYLALINLINKTLMIKYGLSENCIFYVTFSGTVSMDDIRNYLLEFGKLTGLPENLLAMYDLRSVNLNLSASDIILISELTDIATASYESVKTAFLVDSPNLTEYSLLFTEELVSDKKKERSFFYRASRIKLASLITA